MEMAAVILYFIAALCAVTAVASVILVCKARTDAKRLREGESGLEEKLKQARQVNEQKGDMLFRMCRRVGASASKMANTTRAALRNMDESGKLKAYLGELDESSRQMLDVVNDVMEVSGLETGKFAVKKDTFQFHTLIRSFEIVFQNQTQQKGIQFEMAKECDIDEPLVGDVMRVNQIVHNLMTNALHATRPGGEIILEIRTVGASKDSVCIRFSVTDTGCGIAEKDFERIFLPFERLDGTASKAGDGAGLGLYVAKRYTELMGGAFKMRSKTGRGSTFEVDIPFEKVRRETQAIKMSSLETGKSEAHAYNFKGRRVLIAEDNQLHMSVITELIQATGADVDQVVDGREAVDQFKNSPESYYDMILMDIAMPIMDGYEATRRIRRLDRQDSKTVPIYALTANTFEEDEIKSWDEGMNGHINKPISRDRIFSQMEKEFDADS